MIRVFVSEAPLDPATLIAGLPSTGALATFIGRVRADDGVTELMLEHYPGATERALRDIGEAAVVRWRLAEAVIVHRVGAMGPGEPIVFVAAASAHRRAALDACAFIIDRLKTDAPFWKRERRGADTRWVEQRGGDRAAAARWDQPPDES
ncbi:MAG TPA: molybdenum cofactor biosynthesis protein MoaE [Sphingomonas sp.]|nr:molybdenum cofactor biosynthesis protein MoaE [Sphingomonas sp.]